MTKSPFRHKKNAARLATSDVFVVSTDSTVKVDASYFFGEQASANFAYLAASAAFFCAFAIVAKFA